MERGRLALERGHLGMERKRLGMERGRLGMERGRLARSLKLRARCPRSGNCGQDARAREKAGKHARDPGPQGVKFMCHGS